MDQERIRAERDVLEKILLICADAVERFGLDEVSVRIDDRGFYEVKFGRRVTSTSMVSRCTVRIPMDTADVAVRARIFQRVRQL
jgi:hypothetical protein